MNIIETYNLTRRFGRTEAVQCLDLAVPTGSICALRGPNGAGKTTTLKLIMNLLRPTSGEARVLGVDSRRLGEREFAQIGYVSENQQQPLWMTVRQLLDYCRPFYPTWDRDLEKKLFTQFDLPEDRKLKHLSRGMLMKAVLISSLAYRPKLLVLDEPFSGLDPLVRDEFIHGVLEVSALGDWSVVVSTHDIAEVERLADQVVMLSGGRLSFSEGIESLHGRFRRVVAEGVRDVTTRFDGIHEWEQAGNLTKFVTTQYAGEPTEAMWKSRLGEAEVTFTPMSLREIFVTLAHSERKGGQS